MGTLHRSFALPPCDRSPEECHRKGQAAGTEGNTSCPDGEDGEDGEGTDDGSLRTYGSDGQGAAIRVFMIGWQGRGDATERLPCRGDWHRAVVIAEGDGA